MHITIIAVGSHGDVQPCIALGLGLKRAGYQVRIAAHGVFSDFVESFDLEFAAIAGNPRELMDQQPGQTWLQSGDKPVAFMRGLKRLTTRDTIKKGQADVLEACRGTDAVIYSMFGAAGYHVAEMLGVHSMFALLQPFSRTREFPAITLPGRSLGGSGNWLTHVIGERLIWQMVRVPYNRWRREVLNLKPMGFRGPSICSTKTVSHTSMVLAGMWYRSRSIGLTGTLSPDTGSWIARSIGRLPLVWSIFFLRIRSLSVSALEV